MVRINSPTGAKTKSGAKKPFAFLIALSFLWQQVSAVKILVALLFVLSASSKVLSQHTYNITAYGAKGDSKTVNTNAIQSAIDAAFKNGKGKVIVPVGYFITGPLTLRSNVELHLNDGAVLLGSTHRMDYGDTNAAPLIGAKNATNISITGTGIINGQGRELVKDLIHQLTIGKLQDKEWKTKRPAERNRPRLILFEECNNVNVKGITLKNGSGWIQDYVRCNNVFIDSIRVESTEYWNNDGIDIVNSKNVRITNCYVDVADDAICLKSEGKVGTCENVYVANCVLRSSASGFKLGTGSYGGFKNITVRNLMIRDTYRSAIALEAVDGGFIENVDVQNITATNTGNAILIRLGHRNTTDKYSNIKKVNIAHIKVEVPAGKPDAGYPVEGPPLKFAHNVFPSSITGIPGHPVEDVTIEDVNIIYEGGGNKDVAYFGADTLERLPETIAGYPEFSMFGEMPAWGFYVRHAENVMIKNIKLSYKEDDFRAAVIFDDVKNLQLADISIPTAKELPVIILNNVSEVFQKNIRLSTDNSKAIEVKNKKSSVP